MSVQIRVKVVAMDSERGVKATREETVDVPGKIMKLYEVLGGDEDEVLRRIGDTVFASALREVQASRANMGQVMAAAGGGRIGGRGKQQPLQEGQRQEEAAAPAAAPDPLASMLGLDIIRNQDRRERAARQMAQVPQGPRQAPPPRQAGPGPIGFPRR